jgi:AraC-like DNA-binding protein
MGVDGFTPIGRQVPAQIRIRAGEGASGLERLEASITGVGFAPHRHDTYAIGVTMSGVQTFRYRGAERHGLPGQGHILHPDEVHDGRPGTAEGFRYRILYVDPALVQQAFGAGRRLPFVADPIVKREHLDPDLLASLRNLDEEVSDQQSVDMAVTVADMLARLSRTRTSPRLRLALDALERVSDLIRSDPVARHAACELERVAGHDRWSLARQFRMAFGTSPSRFRTMRQLDLARRGLEAGRPLGDVALAAGFADQAHFSRMFRRTYGLTPTAWRSAHRSSER